MTTSLMFTDWMMICDYDYNHETGLIVTQLFQNLGHSQYHSVKKLAGVL